MQWLKCAGYPPLLLMLLCSTTPVLADQEQIRREMVETLKAYAVYKMGQYETAFTRWQVLAEKGNPHGILNLANMYQAGKGVEQDLAKAVYWYRQGAAQGDPLSLYQLAQAHEQGLGVAADPDRAEQFYQQAAEAGSIEAQHRLAQNLLQQGRTDAARQWLQRAADAGDWQAQDLLNELNQQKPAAKTELTPQQRKQILALLAELDDATSTRDAARLTEFLAPTARINVRLPGQSQFQILTPAEYQALWQATFDETERYRFNRVGFTAETEPEQPVMIHSEIQEYLIQANAIQKLQLAETLHVVLTAKTAVIERLTLDVQIMP